MDLAGSDVGERNPASVNYLHGNWLASQAAILYPNKLIRESIPLKVEQLFKEIVLKT